MIVISKFSRHPSFILAPLQPQMLDQPSPERRLGLSGSGTPGLENLSARCSLGGLGCNGKLDAVSVVTGLT